MVELSTPVGIVQSKGCRFNSCPFHSFCFLVNARSRDVFENTNGEIFAGN